MLDDNNKLWGEQETRARDGGRRRRRLNGAIERGEFKLPREPWAHKTAQPLRSVRPGGGPNRPPPRLPGASGGSWIHPNPLWVLLARSRPGRPGRVGAVTQFLWPPLRIAVGRSRQNENGRGVLLFWATHSTARPPARPARTREFEAVWGLIATALSLFELRGSEFGARTITTTRTWRSCWRVHPHTRTRRRLVSSF